MIYYKVDVIMDDLDRQNKMFAKYPNNVFYNALYLFLGTQSARLNRIVNWNMDKLIAEYKKTPEFKRRQKEFEPYMKKELCKDCGKIQKDDYTQLKRYLKQGLDQLGSASDTLNNAADFASPDYPYKKELFKNINDLNTIYNRVQAIVRSTR